MRGIQLFLGFRMQKLRWKHLLVSTLVFLALLLEWKTLKIRLFLRFFSHNILLIIINCCPPIILLLLLALQLLRFWFNYHPCMIPRFRFSQPALLQEGKFAFELGFAVISGDGDPDIFVRILQQGLDEGYVFLLDLFIDPWLVLFGHRSDYLVNVVSILLHFLVVAATLVGVSSYNHITNHFVNPCKFFLFRVLKQVPEEPQKDSILEAFLLIPMPVSLVFAKSAERRLNDPEGQMLRNWIISKDSLLYTCNDLVLHAVCY